MQNILIHLYACQQRLARRRFELFNGFQSLLDTVLKAFQKVCYAEDVLLVLLWRHIPKTWNRRSGPYQRITLFGASSEQASITHMFDV